VDGRDIQREDALRGHDEKKHSLGGTMKIAFGRASTGVVAGMTLLSALSASHAQKADPAAVAEHIAAATAAAKSDLLGPLTLCQTATPAPGPSFMDNYRAMVTEPPLAPMQVMDELYFLGSRWTTAWAIKTAGRLIIVDTMDNADEAEHYIEGGLRKLGLDPAEIRYVVISHGHGDHYGGAAYLQQKFNPCIVMSEIDWNALEETQRDPLFGTKRNPLFGEPPKRDMAVADGDTIQLAGTALKFHVIPGHTLGTLATMFTVHDRGEPHRAVAWGGTAYNFGAAARSAAALFRHHDKIPRDPQTGKRRHLPVEPCQLRRRRGKDGGAERSRAGSAQSVRGRAGCGTALPDRSRGMRAGDKSQHRRGHAGQIAALQTPASTSSQ
jgi:metallo-beta-lactamase class B